VAGGWACGSRADLKPSDQFHSELTADSQRCALHRVQSDAGVCWVEEAVKRATAGMHPDGHRGFGEAVLLHGGFDLIGEDLLDSLGLGLFENALLCQEVVEKRPYSPLCFTFHLSVAVPGSITTPVPAA